MQNTEMRQIIKFPALRMTKNYKYFFFCKNFVYLHFTKGTRYLNIIFQIEKIYSKHFYILTII